MERSGAPATTYQRELVVAVDNSKVIAALVAWQLLRHRWLYSAINPSLFLSGML